MTDKQKLKKAIQESNLSALDIRMVLIILQMRGLDPALGLLKQLAGIKTGATGCRPLKKKEPYRIE